MASASLTATAFARVVVLTDEGTPILWAEERDGDDAFESDLSAALPSDWALIEDEDGDLVAVRT